MNPTDSNIITWLRFPLIVAVVCIHCNLVVSCPWTQHFPLFSAFSYLWIDEVCYIAVAAFFFISGLLFFRNNTFTAADYRHKLHSRLRTIVLPYVLWNIIYFLIIWLLQTLRPGFLLLLHKPVADFTIGDFAWIFWDVSQITHLPTDQHSSLVSQFWFLQCLVLIILFSPVIWAGVKRFGLLIPLLFFVLDKTEVVPDWPGLVAYSWAYFTLGAFFAIRGISVSQLIYRYQRPIGLAIAILLVLDVTLHQYGTQSFVVRHLLKSSLIALLFIVAQQMIARGCNMPSLLVGSTFFVFAVHRFFTAICTNVAGSVPLLTGNSLTALTTYVVSCALSTLLSVFFYWSCRHYFPKACNLLTGNRQ